MIRTLQAASLRHLLRHPAQLALALAGLALGVGTLTAVDIATASAGRAFELSMDAVNGAATHQIAGPSTGFDERAYVALRTRSLGLEIAPVVEGYVTVRDRTLQLLGIDPFTDARVRGRGGHLEMRTGAQGWLTENGAVSVARLTATQLHIAVGESFEIEIGGRKFPARLRSILDDAGAGFETLLITDIAQAQEWLGTVGQISRIDVRAPPDSGGEAAIARLRASLPSGLELVPTQRRSQESFDLSRAFRINLQAMSLLALLVSVFLIYGAISFAMVQRRRSFGVLRALGATRTNVLAVVIVEATALGLVGSAVGVLLGLAIGRELITLVSRTINDLYFVVAVNEVVLPAGTLIKAILCGLGVALVAAILPAIEVVNSPPQLGLRRSSLELRATGVARWLALASMLLAAACGALVLISERSLFAGFLALLLLLLSVAALAPAALRALAIVAARLAAGTSTVLRLSFGAIAASLSRTGVAVASLGMAVTAMIGVAVMIGSFRESLRDWLDRSLRADFYVSAPGPGFARPERKLDPASIDALLGVPGVADHSEGRRITVESSRGPITLDALNLASAAYPGFELVQGNPQQVWPAFRNGEIVISEPLAWRLDLTKGDSLSLSTPSGSRALRIAGVYREYGNDRGNALISRASYVRTWGDDAITTLAIYMRSGADAAKVAAGLRAATAGRQALFIRSNADVRTMSMRIFDRTFVITRVLYWLAAGVAAAGLLSALLAWQLERSREIAIMRSLGLTPRGAAVLIEAQTVFMGLTTFLAALPAGLLTALLLIEVINRRAFGWRIELHIAPGNVGNALLLALAAALIAGCYPAWRAARLPLAGEMREE